MVSWVCLREPWCPSGHIAVAQAAVLFSAGSRWLLLLPLTPSLHMNGTYSTTMSPSHDDMDRLASALDSTTMDMDRRASALDSTKMSSSHNDMNRLALALDSTTLQHSMLYLRILSFVRASFRLGRRSVQHSLGNFGVLPLELREQIWLYVHDSPIVYAAPVCDTKPFPLLCCCKALRKEIIHTITRHREVRFKSPKSLHLLASRMSTLRSTISEESSMQSYSTPRHIYVDLFAALPTIPGLLEPTTRHGWRQRERAIDRLIGDDRLTLGYLIERSVLSHLEAWHQGFMTLIISRTTKSVILGYMGRIIWVCSISTDKIDESMRRMIASVRWKSGRDGRIEVDGSRGWATWARERYGLRRSL